MRSSYDTQFIIPPDSCCKVFLEILQRRGAQDTILQNPALVTLRHQLGYVQRRFQCSVRVLCLLAVLPHTAGQITATPLQIVRPTMSNGWVRLNSAFRSNTVLTLEASTNLAAWRAIGT